MGTIASQITSVAVVYSTVYSGADQRKHQSSASLAFVWGIHRRPVNSPHKWPVTRKMFPFDDVIMMSIFSLKNSYRIGYLQHVRNFVSASMDSSRKYIQYNTVIHCHMPLYNETDLNLPAAIWIWFHATLWTFMSTLPCKTKPTKTAILLIVTHVYIAIWNGHVCDL